MASNQVLVEAGTQILFNNSATYAPAAALSDIEVATPTDVAIDLTAILTTEARMSAQVDLGATRAPSYCVTAAIEMQATPTTRTTWDFYWAASAVATAGTGNPGGVTGLDADYTGTPATLAEGLAKLIFIGPLNMSADAIIQVGTVNGAFFPPTRYGCLIAVNNSGATSHTDVIETAIAFDPQIPDIQAAA